MNKNKVTDADLNSGNSQHQQSFCPICQLPLNCLKIVPSVHVNNCLVYWENLQECKDGANCVSTSVFHYRDYSHYLLAQHRSLQNDSCDSVEKDFGTGDDLRKRKSLSFTNEDSESDEVFSKKCCKRLVTKERKVKRTRKRCTTKRRQCSTKAISLSGTVSNTSENNCEEMVNASQCLFEETSYTFSVVQDDSSQDTNKMCVIKQEEILSNNILPDNHNTVEEKSESFILDDEDLFDSKMKSFVENGNKFVNGEGSSNTEQKQKGSKLEWQKILDGVQTVEYSHNKFGKNKICPSYKKIPGTRFAVDAFEYGKIEGVSAYFLSHFHYDHYIGLKKTFSLPLYCTEITANLVKKKIKVSAQFIHILECKKPLLLEKVEIIPLDANHCPGSVILLFRLPNNGPQYLHTGDFRASRQMEKEPLLIGSHIHTLFLDTTYFNPSYTFPSQAEVISRVRSIVNEKNSKHPDCLFVCGTYTIGKEKVFVGIIEELKCKLWAESSKRAVFECYNHPVILSALVNDPKQARVHVLPMGRLKFEVLEKYIENLKPRFSNVVAFRPTGWELDHASVGDWVSHSARKNVSIYGVPYSEHSSYSELCRFVKFLKPSKVIPTVNTGNRNMHSLMKSVVQSYADKPAISPQKQSSIFNYFSSSLPSK